MKQLIGNLLYRLGYQIRHRSDDPLVVQLDKIREQIRLNCDDTPTRLYNLSHFAFQANIRELLNLHKPDFVVDVGANRGQFASEIRSIGYLGPLVSIEAQTELAKELKERARHDLHWTVLHSAVGDETGRVDLNVFEDNTFSSLHEPSEEAKRRFGVLVNKVRKETVPVDTLDQLLKDVPGFAAANRILLKSDTQGHELAVFRGGTEALRRSIMVLAEASFHALYDTSPTLADFQQILSGHGFKLAAIHAISHDSTDLKLLEADCVFTRPSNH